MKLLTAIGVTVLAMAVLAAMIIPWIVGLITMFSYIKAHFVFVP